MSQDNKQGELFQPSGDKIQLPEAYNEETRIGKFEDGSCSFYNLKTVKFKHKIIIDLAATGMSNKMIASSVGMSECHVGKLLAHPKIQEEADSILAGIRNSANHIILEATVEAAGKLADQAKAGDFKAIVKVLEKAKVLESPGGPKTVNNNTQNNFGDWLSSEQDSKAMMHDHTPGNTNPRSGSQKEAIEVEAEQVETVEVEDLPAPSDGERLRVDLKL